MSWRISRNEQLGIIEITYKGTIARAPVEESTAEALSVAEGNSPTRFLSDWSDARAEVSITDIYDIPNQWRRLGANRRNQLAVVLPQGAVEPEKARFYERVTRNSGWEVRLFGEREPAVEWLTGNSPSENRLQATP